MVTRTELNSLAAQMVHKATKGGAAGQEERRMVKPQARSLTDRVNAG